MSAVSAAASFAGVAVRAAAPGRRANDRAARLVVSASDKFARTSIDLSKRCVPRLGTRTADDDTRRTGISATRDARARDADAPPCPRADPTLTPSLPLSPSLSPPPAASSAPARAKR